jgi:hypothetical protein
MNPELQAKILKAFLDWIDYERGLLEFSILRQSDTDMLRELAPSIAEGIAKRLEV